MSDLHELFTDQYCVLRSDPVARLGHFCRGQAGEMSALEHRTGTAIRFNDGAAYERMMGTWSQLAGEVFIRWLAPEAGQRWIDVACGNGAFTQIIVDRCAPVEVCGVDPSRDQLLFAQSRPAARLATFGNGDAMALPFPDTSFDAAVMALAIYFVPDTERAIDEMIRVTRPGGSISTYTWDMPGGGSPTALLRAEMQAIGIAPLDPPNNPASRMAALQTLWTRMGLENIRSREIVVTREFDSFDDFWMTSLLGPNVRPVVEAASEAEQERLKLRVRRRLTIAANGRVICTARANAITGRKPGKDWSRSAIDNQKAETGIPCA
jgi:ubiquinone/menaquinone biosynthesis C-methylase UbiE